MAKRTKMNDCVCLVCKRKFKSVASNAKYCDDPCRIFAKKLRDVKRDSKRSLARIGKMIDSMLQ